MDRASFRAFGSSPRVRGTVRDLVQPYEVARFIPAGAGNRLLLQISVRVISVHPRGCGEQYADWNMDVR